MKIKIKSDEELRRNNPRISLISPLKLGLAGRTIVVSRFDANDDKLPVEAGGFWWYVREFEIAEGSLPEKICDFGEYSICISDDGAMTVGCQDISKKEAMEIISKLAAIYGI